MLQWLVAILENSSQSSLLLVSVNNLKVECNWIGCMYYLSFGIGILGVLYLTLNLMCNNLSIWLKYFKIIYLGLPDDIDIIFLKL